MAYSFDEIIDRRDSGCLKYDALRTRWHREDLTPLWVADMDFRTPDFVIEAIKGRLDHGILGYTSTPDRWYNAIVNWQKSHYGLEISKEEILFIPGIVRGITFVELAFTNPGDKVMVMPPVYHPFFLVTKKAKREVVYCPLNLVDGRYMIDFEKFEKDIQGCKVLVMSSPHNPGGRVWAKEELAKIAEIAKKSGTLVISDEIHADMTFKGYTHHPYPTVSEDAAQNSIVFCAPTKVFNMPGVVSSYAIIKNPEIREQYQDFLDSFEGTEGNMFTWDAAAACYEKGEQWRQDMLEYVSGNLDYLEEFLPKNVPGVKMLRPEASFLAWLDCRELGLSQEALVDLFVDKAHLALNDGSMFGKEGKGFMRLNVACPRAILEKAMNQLADAVANINK